MTEPLTVATQQLGPWPEPQRPWLIEIEKPWLADVFLDRDKKCIVWWKFLSTGSRTTPVTQSSKRQRSMGRNLPARAVSSATQGLARPLSPVAPVRRQRRRTSGALLRSLDLGEIPVGECNFLSCFNCSAFVVCVVRPLLFSAGDRGGPELGHRAGTVASLFWAGGGTHLPLSGGLLLTCSPSNRQIRRRQNFLGAPGKLLFS